MQPLKWLPSTITIKLLLGVPLTAHEVHRLATIHKAMIKPNMATDGYCAIPAALMPNAQKGGIHEFYPDKLHTGGMISRSFTVSKVIGDTAERLKRGAIPAPVRPDHPLADSEQPDTHRYNDPLPHLSQGRDPATYDFRISKPPMATSAQVPLHQRLLSHKKKTVDYLKDCRATVSAVITLTHIISAHCKEKNITITHLKAQGLAQRVLSSIIKQQV